MVVTREAAEFFLIAGLSPAIKNYIFSAISARSARDCLYLCVLCAFAVKDPINPK